MSSLFPRGNGSLTWAQTLKDDNPTGGIIPEINGVFDVLLGTGETPKFTWRLRSNAAVTWFSRSAATGLLTYSGDIEDSDVRGGWPRWVPEVSR